MWFFIREEPLKLQETESKLEMAETHIYECSFCAAKSNEPKVKCMVAGVNGAICDDCIELSAGILGDRLGYGEVNLTATDLHMLRRIQQDRAIALSVVLRNRQLIEENVRLKKALREL